MRLLHHPSMFLTVLVLALAAAGAKPSCAESEVSRGLGIGTAKLSAGTSAPSSAAAAAANIAPPPATVHVVKQGECPLTKDASGAWRGPDGKTVDAATAKMGDCK